MGKTARQEPATHEKARRLGEARLWLLARPYTAGELARALGVHVRTAQRYLGDLGAVPLDERARPPRYRLLTSEELSPVEALVTHSALRMLYHHAPGHNAIYLEALLKLARRMPEPAQGVAIRSTEDLKRRLSRRLDEGDALGKVAEAWFRQQAIEFYYRKPGGSGQARRNEVEVYFVEISRLNLGVYVIGYERGYHRKLRTYKLNRMSRIRPVGEAGAYSIPADFDPRRYLSDAWGVVGGSGGEPVEVRLRFRPEAAYRLREGGYPDMELLDLPDGGLEARFMAGTDNEGFPLEILSWVQGWGPRVEVLEPENLRRRWLEEARQVLGEYAGDSRDRAERGDDARRRDLSRRGGKVRP